MTDTLTLPVLQESTHSPLLIESIPTLGENVEFIFLGQRRGASFYTMAQLTSDVTYDQLKRIGDWHLTEEAQRSALAELVSAITDLDTSSRWGEGRTAASDGQPFTLKC